MILRFSALTVLAIQSVNTSRSNVHLFWYNNYSSNSIANEKLLYYQKIPEHLYAMR